MLFVVDIEDNSRILTDSLGQSHANSFCRTRISYNKQSKQNAKKRNGTKLAATGSERSEKSFRPCVPWIVEGQ